MVNPRVLGSTFRGAGHRLISLWPHFFSPDHIFFPANMGPGLSENSCVHFGWCFFCPALRKQTTFISTSMAAVVGRRVGRLSHGIKLVAEGALIPLDDAL